MYLMYALAVGFIAWALPVAAMLRRKNYTSASFAFCSASLFLAIMDTQQLVRKDDWAAIEDTHGGVLFGATALIIITAALNLVAAIANRKKP